MTIHPINNGRGAAVANNHPAVAAALDRRKRLRILPYACWPIRKALEHLYDAPRTTRELAALLGLTSYDMAPELAKQAKRGRIVRIDGGKGPGTIAVYDLTPAVREAIAGQRNMRRAA